MISNAFSQSLQLLRTRRFGIFWFASLLSNIGTWAQQVAQPWLLLSLGASPFLLGLDAFALAAPVFLLTLVGGALADAKDRRRIILIFQSIQLLCPVALVLLLLFGTVQPWMVIALSLVVGVTDGLSMPSFQSIVPSIVQERQIATGIALNSTQFNLSRIVGPAIAGVLMSSVGAVGAFAVSAASYLPFMVVALWILPGGLAAVQGEGFKWHRLKVNVATVLRHPLQRGALLTVFITGLLCAPLVIFCPVLVKTAFAGDVSHFSLAVSAFGMGGLIGAIGLLGVGEKRERRTLCSGFAILFGLVVVMAAWSNSHWLLPLLFAVAGVAMTISNASANSILQASVSAPVRGQTASLFMLAMRGGMAIGGLLTGLSVSAWGIREALCINGVLAVVLQLVVAKRWSRVALPVAINS